MHVVERHGKNPSNQRWFPSGSACCGQTVRASPGSVSGAGLESGSEWEGDRHRRQRLGGLWRAERRRIVAVLTDSGSGGAENVWIKIPVPRDRCGAAMAEDLNARLDAGIRKDLAGIVMR